MILIILSQLLYSFARIPRVMYTGVVARLSALGRAVATCQKSQEHPSPAVVLNNGKAMVNPTSRSTLQLTMRVSSHSPVAHRRYLELNLGHIGDLFYMDIKFISRPGVTTGAQ